MKTSMKIAVAIAVVAVMVVVALAGSALAYGGQGSATGWMGQSNGMMNGYGMMNGHCGIGMSQPHGMQSYPTTTSAPSAATTGQIDGNARFCSIHNCYCTHNAQTGIWTCPYGCMYHDDGVNKAPQSQPTQQTAQPTQQVTQSQPAPQITQPAPTPQVTHSYPTPTMWQSYGHGGRCC